MDRSFSLCELSAQCIAEALLFGGMIRRLILPFRDQALSEESAPNPLWLICGYGDHLL
jgi:hypothetical protein